MTSETPGVRVYLTRNNYVGDFYAPVTEIEENLKIGPTHIAFPLDAASLAGMREEFEAIISLRDFEDRRDRLNEYLSALGLTGDAP